MGIQLGSAKSSACQSSGKTREKTPNSELVSKNFIWDEWSNNVARCVAAYVKCQSVKQIGIADKQGWY